MTERLTALVTGASMGLGLDYARLAARDGMNVVLVARSRDKLEALARELEAAHGVRALSVPADLTVPGAPEAIFEAVKSAGLSIDVLINNAGFGTTGPFLESPREKELEMIQVNVTALVALTHLFAKEMVARGRGRILQVASTAGFQAGPGMATYFATKAFVISLGEALAHELRGTGVSVTTHCPGATATSFASTAGNDKTPLFQRPGVARSTDVALHGYRAMLGGQVLSIHGIMNWLSALLVRFSPRFLLRPIVAFLNRPS